jgi:hypothetical protein
LITYSTGPPDKPQPPTMSINNKFVRVSWTAPVNNYEALDAYQIKLSTTSPDGFVQDTTYCDGANLVIFNRQYCQIPVSLFSDPNYLYKLYAGFEIKAIVAARNKNGWGPFSQPSTTGAQLETLPN